MANDFENEYDMRIVYTCDGVSQTWDNQSKLAPMKMTFKFGEEFTIVDPVLHENCKVNKS